MKKMSRIKVRPFVKDDYEVLVGIWNQIYPEYPSSIQEVKYNDQHEDPRCKHARFMAELDGETVGTGEYYQLSAWFHPQKFYIDISVKPEARKKGVGSAIYEVLLEKLAPLEPISLRCRVREDMTEGRDFLEHRGFEENFREWESRLEVSTFDFRPHSGLIESLESRGFLIKTYKELESDPDRDSKLHKLWMEINEDIPFPDPPTTVPFETFLDWMRFPGWLQDGFFVMLYDGEYVGLSNLLKSQDDPSVSTGLTGVRRKYRKMGIATALKLKTVEYARKSGFKYIKTWNASYNQVMLYINEKLGFKKQVAWISYLKKQASFSLIIPTAL